MSEQKEEKLDFRKSVEGNVAKLSQKHFEQKAEGELRENKIDWKKSLILKVACEAIEKMSQIVSDGGKEENPIFHELQDQLQLKLFKSFGESVAQQEAIKKARSSIELTKSKSEILNHRIEQKRTNFSSRLDLKNQMVGELKEEWNKIAIEVDHELDAIV